MFFGNFLIVSREGFTLQKLQKKLRKQNNGITAQLCIECCSTFKSLKYFLFKIMGV